MFFFTALCIRVLFFIALLVLVALVTVLQTSGLGNEPSFVFTDLVKLSGSTEPRLILEALSFVAGTRAPKAGVKH